MLSERWHAARHTSAVYCCTSAVYDVGHGVKVSRASSVIATDNRPNRLQVAMVLTNVSSTAALT